MGNSQSNQDIQDFPLALKEVSVNSDLKTSSTVNSSNERIENTDTNNIVITQELKLKNLKSINEIDLCNNNLVKLYPNIGYLYTTTSLKLCCNYLTEIPSEIGYLKNLRTLNLSNNKIERIPNTICYLKNLTCLNFSNNKIKIIPTFINKLANLTILNLSNNQIELIPSEIGELKNLIYLNLSENLIQYLPIEINNIVSLAELDVENCPLASSFDECHPAFILSSEMKDLVVSRNQKLLLESSKYQNNATLDMLNELVQYKKYYSNNSSLSLTCDQNDLSIFDLNNNKNCHCQFFNEIMLNKKIRVNSSSTTLNQEIENETLSLNEENDEDNSTIEEPINNENKIELRIPTLKELAARTIVRNRLLMPTNILPENLLNYLSFYKSCSFCHGPYFETYIRRVRIIPKFNKDIPFEYRLCRAHFNTNEERIREMFKIRPITAPKSLVESDRSNIKEKKYKYKENCNSNLYLDHSNSTTKKNSFYSSNSKTLTTLSSSSSSLSQSSVSSHHKSSMKSIFGIKSKHQHRKNSNKDSSYLVKGNSVHNLFNCSSNKFSFNQNKKEFTPLNPVTINELIYMKQPLLPSLPYSTEFS